MLSSLADSGLPERRDSLPTRGRGFKGVRRSTPLLDEDARDERKVQISAGLLEADAVRRLR